MASMVVAAGMFQSKDERQSLAQATMALLQGLEIGISPMQAAKNIAVINGKPAIWGSLVPALIWKAGHKIEEWMEEADTENMTAHCKITRADNGYIVVAVLEGVNGHPVRRITVQVEADDALWDVIEALDMPVERRVGDVREVLACRYEERDE